jgi:hypothetical protein
MMKKFPLQRIHQPRFVFNDEKGISRLFCHTAGIAYLVKDVLHLFFAAH